MEKNFDFIDGLYLTGRRKSEIFPALQGRGLRGGGMIWGGLLSISFLLLFSSSALASAPRDALDGASARIKQILSKPFEKDSPAEKKVKDGVKKVVTDFLDYGELAKRSMGKNWNDRTPAEKKEFVGLLQDLIEASYLNKITGNADYTVDFLDETEEDGDALINTNLKAKSGSINVGFRLHQVGDKWMCFDLLIDDVSTLRNYKGEFNKIIKDKGYDGLVKRMKEKAAEIKKD